MNDFKINVELVANYKGTDENYLFISCDNGTGGKYKISSLDEIKEKIMEYIETYLEWYEN